MQIYTDMMLALTILLASFDSLAVEAVAANAPSNITYKVVSNIPENHSLAVILDNKQLYPLNNINEATSLLYAGEAPRPFANYNYAIIDKSTNTIVSQEPFSRTLPANITSTMNEHFNRSRNIADEYQLPKAFAPLPIIHRVASRIHVPGQIPTIHIMGNQSGIDYMHSHQLEEMDIEGLKMAYISVDEVKTFDGVTFSLSGRSTRLMPKLSYSIKLPKKQDLYNYRRFKLRAGATDPSYMTENTGYSIANAIGLPASQASYARLYINNQSIGLFGFVEHLKDPWLSNEFADGDKNYNHGTLWVGRNSFNKSEMSKGETSSTKIPSIKVKNNQQRSQLDQQLLEADFSYFGDGNLNLYKKFYPVKEKPSKGEPNYSRIIDFTKFLSEQSNTTVVNNSVIPQWEQHIDVESFLRTMVLDILTMDTDGFVINNNNFFLYNDPVNNRLVLSEQDFDLSCGIVLPQFNASRVWSGNYYEFPGLQTQPLSSKILNVPQFRERFDGLMRNATRELFASGAVQRRIDALYHMLKEDVEWDKSLPFTGKFAWKLPRNVTVDPYTKFRDLSFKQAVYGPGVISIQTPIAEWAKRRGGLLEAFLNRTTIIC